MPALLHPGSTYPHLQSSMCLSLLPVAPRLQPSHELIDYDFIYLFMKDTHTHRGKDTGRGRSRLHAGTPMWDSIPGPQDHALGQRQVPNR